MKTKFSMRARGIAWLCTLVYFASYLMRINFSVMIARICVDTGFSETELAVVLTGLTIFYGTGQIVNGFLGDRIPPNKMLTFGLCLAAACNVGMFFCTTVPLMTVVWCINGFAHAMLWPPIVRLLSTYLNDEEYSYAAVRVSWGSSFATIFLYLLCPVFLSFMTWRAILLSLAVIGIIIAVVWTVSFPKLFILPKKETEEAPASPEEAPKKKKGAPLPPSVFLPVVLIFLGIVLQGMLRDGVTTWMPTLLSDSFGFDVESSIFYTVILAIFSILSFSGANFLHRKLFTNEVTCAGAIFAFSALCTLLLILLQGSAIASILLMAIIVAGMHGINLMLITVVPKRFVKSGRVSTFSGILNAGTYVGAAIAMPAFAAIAEHFGSWSVTITVWLIVSALGALVCFVAVPMWKRFRKNYADNPDI
ncbi:MAG: MFS transporter [Clostridia bacterium]|nr:MFS transporter [Clostridia bacterium]